MTFKIGQQVLFTGCRPGEMCINCEDICVGDFDTSDTFKGDRFLGVVEDVIEKDDETVYEVRPDGVDGDYLVSRASCMEHYHEPNCDRIYRMASV